MRDGGTFGGLNRRTRHVLCVAMEQLLPDYEGACISRIVPSLFAPAPADWFPAEVAGASSVVLLVLDGLGWHELERHRSVMPALGTMSGGPITTVVPATTASALTSLTTGLAPSQHGVTGYRMRVDQGVLNVLAWHVGSAKPPDPHEVQRHPAFGGRSVAVVTRSEFRGSGFTRAHMDGARFVGWHTPAVLVQHCIELVGVGDRLVYAYYPGIDTVAHEFGLDQAFYERELAAADRVVGDLLNGLPPDVALIVTSDHGQVQLFEESWVELDELESLVELQAGDARFRSLYAREGARAELEVGARERLGHLAWVLTRAELLDKGWLGPDPIRVVGGRLGDVVLVAREPVGFVDPSLPFERRLRSAHGAPTAAEMLVPLLAARGRAGQC